MVVLVLGGAVLGAAAPKDDEVPKEKPKEKVVIEGKAFQLELAVDDKARTLGLAGREKIEPDGGMLFVFPDTRYRSFWMKECLVKMDLLFLDSRGRIVRVHEMKTEPPRRPDESVRGYERRLKLYASRRPVQFAIELEAGSIVRLKLKPGQAVALDVDRLKKLAR